MAIDGFCCDVICSETVDRFGVSAFEKKGDSLSDLRLIDVIVAHGQVVKRDGAK